MLLVVFSPAVVAAEDEYPVIYVTGSRNPLYADKNNPSQENRIWKIGVDVGAVVKEALGPCLKELAAGVISHDPFPASIDKLIWEFIRSHGELTVFDDERYPQYLSYDAESGTITPLGKVSEPAAEKDNLFTLIAKFFRLLFAVLSAAVKS